MSKEIQNGAPKKNDALSTVTGGVLETVEEIERAIRAVSARYNVVMPGGAMGKEPPALFSVGISFVVIDPEKETYPVKGSSKRGIGKTGLDRIARAAGVRWDPNLCGRIDDGKDSYVVEYQAVGTVLQLDGTEGMIHASKRIDLRAERETPEGTWGTDAQEIAKDAAAANPKREPWPQLLQARQNILSNAETKAKNRAIRTLGVQSSYEPKDIARGFAVVKLQFTGHSDDPVVEQRIQLMIAEKAIYGTSALYGRRESQVVRTVPRLVPNEATDVDTSCDTKTAPAAQAQAPAAAAPAEAPKAEPVKPAHNPSMPVGKKDKDGNFPRKLASEMSVDQLTNLIEYHEGRKPTWEATWAAKNQLNLDALKEWRAFKSYDPAQGCLPPLDEYAGEQGPGDDEIPF
jgi:hypothetical protein